MNIHGDVSNELTLKLPQNRLNRCSHVLGSPPSWICLKCLSEEVCRGHPNQMPELAPNDQQSSSCTKFLLSN